MGGPGGVREGSAEKIDECFTLFAIFAKKGRKLRWNTMENARKCETFVKIKVDRPEGVPKVCGLLWRGSREAPYTEKML